MALDAGGTRAGLVGLRRLCCSSATWGGGDTARRAAGSYAANWIRDTAASAFLTVSNPAGDAIWGLGMFNRSEVFRVWGLVAPYFVATPLQRRWV